jgi:diguanylate cyclase (GGDEF)-like protein
VDRLDAGEDPTILRDSLGLLSELTKAYERSDYNIQLADAIARRFLAIGQLTQAELYGKRAMQWADSGNAILLRRQTSETMAKIMRAQGRLEQALTYLDISQSLWEKLLDERSHKDMAYQRMKFQTQDQSNQLKMLGQINTLLTSERELQERNKHILELLVAVTALLLAFVSVWLMRTWRQKNDYRTFSQVDGLTKVSNRSHLLACASEAFKDARGSIAVVLFDMDEFKQINDTYNHATGDWVLKTVGATISRCLRADDLFGRVGGEEFAICLPNTPEEEAMVLAERCRSAIAAIDSAPSGYNFSITASFGIAVRPPGGGANFEATLAAADQVLYRAKHLGRNRIETFGEIFTHKEAIN